jgi:hypothetical protein
MEIFIKIYKIYKIACSNHTAQKIYLSQLLPKRNLDKSSIDRIKMKIKQSVCLPNYGSSSVFEQE